MRPFLVLPGLVFLVSPVVAAETAWVDVAPQVRMRLISSGETKPDGSALIGLEIDMPQTIKTYWRVPGDTGFPAELDFSRSTGVKAHTVLWPYPTREITPDYLDHVYFGPLVLPVELEVAEAPWIELDAILGICSDICVPAQVRFAFDPAEGGRDRVNGLRLRQALADVPLDWPEKSQPIGTVLLDEDGGQLAVRLLDPRVNAGSLIAATGSGSPLFGAPQKSPEPDLMLVPVLGGSAENDLEGQEVTLTFLTEMGAFEVTRQIESAPQH
ncbi:protein-disulfide reductase DsbD domain-containing protein [Devosia sp.]|uniref:protein-disulfide reductase DsbD domain-containing protein n=1 Tax=Devosia sp. TaxID=1871048 RepID=UPI002AFE3BBF|nr:protein-disulfide reductase DsbD domain-containing protein [Devosia sp.]